jgi:hypothetical protein
MSWPPRKPKCACGVCHACRVRTYYRMHRQRRYCATPGCGAVVYGCLAAVEHMATVHGVQITVEDLVEADRQRGRRGEHAG